MKPNFPEFNDVVRLTLEYFQGHRIKDYVDSLKTVSEGGSMIGYLKDWEDVVFKYHEAMEKEINQNIFGSNQNIQSALFALIKDWLNNDWRICENYQYAINCTVVDYNTKAWGKYNEDIAIWDKSLASSINYDVKHGETYIKKYPPSYSLGGFFTPSHEKEIKNSWFECNTKTPSLIRVEYLPEYYKIVGSVVTNFRNICSTYLDMYESGKIVPNAPVYHLPPSLKEPSKLLLTNPKETTEIKKLPTTLTSGQLLYLFKVLRDNVGSLNKSLSNIDICRFISAHISVRDWEGDLSAENLAKKWSNIDINDIAYWAEFFPEMSKQVIKDNPNKIKYKENKIK